MPEDYEGKVSIKKISLFRKDTYHGQGQKTSCRPGIPALTCTVTTNNVRNFF